MREKAKQILKKIFLAPEIPLPSVNLPITAGHMNTDPEEHAYRQTMKEYARANLWLQQDALQKNIRVMHRTMIVAVIAIIISVAGVATAVIVKGHTYITIQKVVVSNK